MKYWVWFRQFTCFHDWEEFQPILDRPECDFRACSKCDKRELTCI